MYFHPKFDTVNLQRMCKIPGEKNIGKMGCFFTKNLVFNLYRAAKYKKLMKRRAALAAARKDEMRPLTQAEILEEAKITEKINLESLKRFQEMELEAKKKARNNAGSRAIKGHYVRYTSTAMPLIQVHSVALCR